MKKLEIDCDANWLGQKTCDNLDAARLRMDLQKIIKDSPPLTLKLPSNNLQIFLLVLSAFTLLCLATTRPWRLCFHKPKTKLGRGRDLLSNRITDDDSDSDLDITITEQGAEQVVQHTRPKAF